MDNPSTLKWNDSALRLSAEYSPATLEKIRLLAIEGLLALPRVGLGVGGFLLGVRKPQGISVTGFQPIECSHATGPSFSPNDIEIAEARLGVVEGPLAIIGCYCSRPRGQLLFNEKDKTLFARLCPGPGQFAFFIRPSASDVCHAALFCRNPDGTLAGGTPRPLEAFELPAEPEPVIFTPVKPEPVKPVQVRPEPVSVKPEPAPPEPVVIPPLERPSPAVASKLFGEPVPVPGRDNSPPEPKGLPWRTLGVAALLAVLLVAAWLRRDAWMPRPPLELRTAETNGHFFLEWNRAAVRGVDKGVLTVTDGPSSKQIPLSAAQLQQGTIEYPRQTEQVTAVLDAGDTRASARFTPPPVIPDAAPPPQTSHP